MVKVWILLFLILGVGILYLVFSYSSGKSISIISPQQIISHQLDSQKLQDQETYTPLSLEKVFDGKQEEILDSEQIVLLVTGDVIPARSVNYQATVRNNFLWPYEKIASITSHADITFINLETPLMKVCPVTQVGMVFCGSNRHIEGLKLMGVDVASVANNHAGNHGRTGLTETVHLLESNDIAVTGDTDLVIKTVKGIKFGFLGFNDISGGIVGMQHATEETIKARIQEVRDQVDVVVVTYHWGAEYRSQPDDRQKYLAHLTIDSGADLVVANHPHWVQPVEIYNGKVIMYAHGNTIFDQEWSEETKRGVLGKYIFAGKQLVDIEYIPIGIRNYGEAYPAMGEQGALILRNLAEESNRLKAVGGGQVIQH
jgi:poly-gamma-glutamate capsule biosynthesis protein CapA/YwtB (metallophosphatase superfamily)